MCRSKRLHRNLGLSLIEVVVSTVIVAFIISAALRTVDTAIAIRTRTVELQLGPSLARGLLSEVASKAYADPETPNGPLGPDQGESTGTRLGFDDVDDYQGWLTDSPVNAAGADLGIGTGWRREVAIEFLDPSSMTSIATDLGLKRLRVTATSPSGKSTTLETLRARSGANERRASAERSIVTGVGVKIEMVAGQAAEESAALTKNHAIDE